ncbi:hypothetical protein L4P27_006076 [Pseudomonas aeruginosa]|nr:hypothetical protein [Pseudomonas aeruginosa]EKV3012250.1 hypothetical protein [Pseudomonas aeruginosa]
MTDFTTSQSDSLVQRAESALAAGEQLTVDPLELLALISSSGESKTSGAGQAPNKPISQSQEVTDKDLVVLLGKCVEAAGLGYLLGEVYPEEMEVYGERLLEFCKEAKKKHQWPEERSLARLGDMSPDSYFRVDLDPDNDVCLSIWNGKNSASVDFNCPGAGGGQSRFTREALINLMVAIERDNAERPSRDWLKLNSQTVHVKPANDVVNLL